MARGAVVDEAALVRALREGWIAGAGLDVYEHEPKISPELMSDAQHLAIATHRQRDGGDTTTHVDHGGGKSTGGAGWATVSRTSSIHFELERGEFRAQAFAGATQHQPCIEKLTANRVLRAQFVKGKDVLPQGGIVRRDVVKAPHHAPQYFLIIFAAADGKLDTGIWRQRQRWFPSCLDVEKIAKSL